MTSFAMVVDDVVPFGGRATIAGGRVLQGTIRVGNQAFLVRDEFVRPVRVLGIEEFDKPNGERLIGLRLEGVGEHEVRAGDFIQSSPTERFIDKAAPQRNVSSCPGSKPSDALRARIQADGRDRSFKVPPEEMAGLEKELDELIVAVKSCPSFEEAAAALDELGRLQDLLCLVWIKYDAPVSSKQAEFVNKYDRYDDLETRRFAFQAIKEDRFPEGLWP